MSRRRQFLKDFAGAAIMISRSPELQAMSGGWMGAASASGSVCDVAGIKVGHYTESRRPTGCTVILTEEGATAGVEVRGSAPGTRETDLLNPLNTVEKVHAILLAGGSAFGLEAASGVMQYLEDKGIGYPTRVARIPIVPAAILYDLDLGNSKIRPDKQAGFYACRNAQSRGCEVGNVGAGAGATIGKLFGMSRAMKSGIGMASLKVGDLVVGALVAVNAMGDVFDYRTGEILAGARGPDGKSLINTMDQIRSGNWSPKKLAKENTTIGVVATNAALSKTQMSKVAQMAHDGLARSINPVHTPYDGDTLFALSTAKMERSGDAPDLTQIGSLAAESVAMAVRRAVLSAKGLPGLPSHQDLLDSKQKG